MTRASLISSSFATAIALSALLANPAASQSPVKVSPPVMLARDSAVVQPLLVKTPPPSSVRPSRAAARNATPTAAVVAPMERASPPVETIRPGTAAAVAAPAATELLQLAPVAPPVPARAAQTTDARQPAVQDPAPPAGSSGRCRDGSYVSGESPADQCANRGGALAVFPVARVTPRRTP